MESVKIVDYMNIHPVSFTGNMTIEHAVERLLQTRQSGGPVLSDDKKVIGFLSEQDCLRMMLESVYHNAPQAVVKDVMRTEVLKVKPYDSILALADRMLGEQPKLYPVIDDSGALVGMVSRTDVLRAIDKHQHARFPKSNQKPHG